MAKRGAWRKRADSGEQTPSPMDNLPKPQRWPSFAEKIGMWESINVSLFPSQLSASTQITGDRGTARVVLTMGGERAGKSQWTAYEVFALAPWCDLIYITGAQFENTEPEFKYLEALFRTAGLLSSVNKPLTGAWNMTTMWGCEIRTLSYVRAGSDALVTTGRAPDVVVMCEAGMLSDDVFLTALTRVGERRGAVIMSGTLKRSRPWYVGLYDQMKGTNIFNGTSWSFPSWENLTVYPGGRNDPQILQLEAALGDIRFRERIAGEPVPSPLLVFGREFDYKLHVAEVGFDPLLPILLASDPGYAGAYSLLVVQAASDQDVRVIDEFYRQYSTWDEAVTWLRERPYIKVDSHGKIMNVIYGNAVMDVAGYQHHAEKSQIDQWMTHTGVHFLGRRVSILDGITRMRDFLRSPFGWEKTRIRINPKCEGLLWELAQGEVYHSDQEGNPIKENPRDSSNHSRKAISYLLVQRFGRSDGERFLPPEPGHDPFAGKSIGEVTLVRTPTGVRIKRVNKVNNIPTFR